VSIVEAISLGGTRGASTDENPDLSHRRCQRHDYPPEDNAAFAAKFIPRARLDIQPGPVDHEIFGNECDQLGRDNFPAACIDAPGVDRTRLHEYIGKKALEFFDKNLGVHRQSSN
jgi:hypothetical protein